MTATDTASPQTSTHRRRRRKRRQRASNLDRWDLYGLVVCAAGGAMLFNESAATRFRVVDLLLCGLIAAIVALAGSLARRWTLIWLAGIAAAATVGSIWMVPAALALALCALVAIGRRRNKTLDAAVAGLAVLSLFHVPDLMMNGFPTVLAAIALVPVLVSGYKAASSRARRAAIIATCAMGAFVALATLGLGLATIGAKGSFDRGIESATAGLAALGRGDQQGATTDFDDAGTSFDAAHGAVDGPWSWPAYVVPALAPQGEALSTLAASGAAVSHAAADTTRIAPYTQVHLAGGSVDVVRLQAMEGPVRRQADTISAARADLSDAPSNWTMGPIAQRVGQLSAVLEQAQPAANLAADLTRVMPKLLGSKDTRRYLVLVSNPAEARFSGGVLVSYGEITANQGRVAVSRWGPISDLAEAADVQDPTIIGDPVYADRYGRLNPAHNPENLAASPDLPTNLRVISDRYAHARSTTIDGVVLVDPVGLDALLQLTGPVQVPGTAEPLQHGAATSLLLPAHYLTGAATGDFVLSAAGQSTMDAITTRDIPAAPGIADALASSARGGHLMTSVADADAQSVFQRMGVTGAFPDAQRGDYFSVRTASDGPTTLDPYLSRGVRYEPIFNPTTGSVEATATITLTNAPPPNILAAAPPAGAPGSLPGTNALYVSIYTPLGLRGADLNGAPMPVEPQREFAGNVYSTKLMIEPGKPAVIHVRLSGMVKPDPTYRLTTSSQPSSQPDQWLVKVRGSDGWEAATKESAGQAVLLPGGQVLTAELKRR